MSKYVLEVPVTVWLKLEVDADSEADALNMVESETFDLVTSVDAKRISPKHNDVWMDPALDVDYDKMEAVKQ